LSTLFKVLKPLKRLFFLKSPALSFHFGRARETFLIKNNSHYKHSTAPGIQKDPAEETAGSAFTKK